MPTVISADGTKIAYELSGSGPSIILVDGALCSRTIGPMKSIAKLLSSNFTVIQYDRRGRNESGDTKPYSIDREIEDLAALMKELNEEPFVFGISSGAVLILHAAIRGLRFKKIALFEPPVHPTDEHSLGASSPDHTACLTEFIDSNQPDLALKYFLTTMVAIPKLIVGMMRFLPLWKKLKAIAHTLPYDATLTRLGTLTKSELKSIHTTTLVLWGEKSPPFLREAAAEISENLPRSRGRGLKRQTHNVSAKALVPTLKEYFAS
jgi:pimeloyl-ACP methyl ester carboxylesterase